MKILFYLPMLSDWYFDDIVVHLMRVAARDAEVHVAAPPQWCMTGLNERQLMQCFDLPDINWHILDGPDHPSLRSVPSDPDALVDLARMIAADYTFCRSADVSTPMRFPGKIRFLREAVVPPFVPRSGAPGGWLKLSGPGIYDQGMMPLLMEDEHQMLQAMIGSRWCGLQAGSSVSNAAKRAYIEAAGLPTDRRLLVFPLTYEGQIPNRHALESNSSLIAKIGAQLDDDFVVALTQHPLNINPRRAMDRPDSPVEPVVAAYADKMRLVQLPGPLGNPTASLIRCCDGVIVGDTQSFGYAAAFGKPLMRFSRFAAGEWLQAYADLAEFQHDVRARAARRPSETDAMRWFAFHYGNEVFSAQRQGLNLQHLIDRIERPVDSARWPSGVDLIQPGLALAA